MKVLLLVACITLVNPGSSVDISPYVDCSIYDTQLNNVEFQRKEIESRCIENADSKTEFLINGKEPQRSSIESDITKLRESLDCTGEYEIKDYFQCHMDRGAENSKTTSSINSKSGKARREYEKDAKNIDTEKKNCIDKNTKEMDKQSESIKKAKEACTGGAQGVKENI